MCISASDIRAEEIALFVDLLCPDCRETVEAAERADVELLDLFPEEWGFCNACMKAISEHLEMKEVIE